MSEKEKIKEPLDHQKEALENIKKGFRAVNRGKVIMPCGTGKTLIPFFYFFEEGLNTCLICVPSLALLRQTKDEWINNLSEPVDFFCVCSEYDISDMDDSMSYSVKDLGNIGLGVVNEPEDITKLIKNRDRLTPLVCFCTYQSLHNVHTALKHKDVKLFKFDLGVADEAHKTTKGGHSNYGLFHEKSLPIKKRIYMTATPRVLSHFAKDEGIRYKYDMNNVNVFGPTLHHMTFFEAIKRDLLCDYKFFCIAVNEKEVKQMIFKKNIDKEGKITQSSVDDMVNIIALRKAIDNFGVKKILTFHNRVKSANIYRQKFEKLYGDVDCFHVNGSMTTQRREWIMKRFLKSKKSLITNARCLTEGVDVPAMDLVLFSDPKKSVIDITQAIGRVLRKSKGKKLGYVIVPVYLSHENEAREDDFDIKESKFLDTVRILKHMTGFDETLEQDISSKVYVKRVSNPDQKTLERKKAESREKSKVYFLDVPKGIETKVFLKEIRKAVVPFVPFEQAREFIRTLGLSGKDEYRKLIKEARRRSN